MPITVEIDPDKRQALYRASGEISGAEFDKAVGGSMRRLPELTTFDSIVDLTSYVGNVSADDVAAMAVLVNKIRPKDAPIVRSAFVTTDINFRDWMKVMSHQFDGREFRMFATLEQAEAWLAE